MITIKHNFDGSKFMWLWAQYVKKGRIDKHCIGSIPGKLSKKFSGTTNKNLKEQTILVMDEVTSEEYEAIYFCGVLKRGYLNKNPLKNNYQHNVHFAVVPEKGATAVWDFEEWHVEIEGGKLERIPATFELKSKFFMKPYDSHFYTCRIFRWMIGHFYPDELMPGPFDIKEIENGKKYAEAAYVSEVNKDEEYGGYWTNLSKELNKKTGFIAITDLKFKREIYLKDMFCKSQFINAITESAKEKNIIKDAILFGIGVEEYLEMLYPYQERKYFWFD